MKEIDHSQEFTFGKALMAISGREFALIFLGTVLFLVMLLSFVMIVFVISNFDKIPNYKAAG